MSRIGETLSVCLSSGWSVAAALGGTGKLNIYHVPGAIEVVIISHEIAEMPLRRPYAVNSIRRQ